MLVARQAYTMAARANFDGLIAQRTDEDLDILDRFSAKVHKIFYTNRLLVKVYEFSIFHQK